MAIVGFVFLVLAGLYLVVGGAAGFRFFVGISGQLTAGIVPALITLVGFAILWAAWHYAPFTVTFNGKH